MHMEGSGSSHVFGIAHVRVAHAHKQRCHVLKGNLVSNGEGARGKVSRARWRHATQEGRRRRHHNALLPHCQAGDGTAARADNGVIGCGLGPGVIATHGIAGNNIRAKPGGKRPRSAIGRLLTRDDHQAWPGIACPEGSNHQRPGTLSHGKGCVVPTAKLVE